MKLLYLIVLQFLFVACYTPKIIKTKVHDSNYCFKNKVSAGEGKVKLDGYYYFTSVHRKMNSNSQTLAIDTVSIYYVFYQNGLFLYSFNIKSISGFWGSYYLDQDTIYAFAMNPLGSMSSGFVEFKFHILNNNKLEYSVEGKKTDNSIQDIQFNELYSMSRNIQSEIFVPFSETPNSESCWLLKHKWFWCSKKDYKTWKKTYKSYD